jgi:excinuclease UvrABC ATPase subunit
VGDTGWWTPATPVVVVEHDMDTVASADWVIDLGQGGLIVAAGPPAKVAWVEAPHRTSRSGSLPARRRAA